jgi:dodecin
MPPIALEQFGEATGRLLDHLGAAVIYVCSRGWRLSFVLTIDCGGLDWFLFEMMSTDVQRRFVMPATVEMKDHVYKILELVGSSEKGIDDAIQNAISRASKTIRGMKWFEVVQTRGHIEKGAVGHYQVTLRVGFTLEE